jgi:hypothetical protein
MSEELLQKALQSQLCSNINLLNYIKTLEGEVFANKGIIKHNEFHKGEMKAEIEQLKSDLASKQKIIDDDTERIRELSEKIEELRIALSATQEMEEINLACYEEQKSKASNANAKNKAVEKLWTDYELKLMELIRDLPYTNYVKQRRKKRGK